MVRILFRKNEKLVRIREKPAGLPFYSAILTQKQQSGAIFIMKKIINQRLEDVMEFQLCNPLLLIALLFAFIGIGLLPKTDP